MNWIEPGGNAPRWRHPVTAPDAPRRARVRFSLESCRMPSPDTRRIASAHRRPPVGFALGFGAALMESIASVPGPLLAAYLISSGATGRAFTKQIAIILVVSIVTLITTFSGAAHASAADLAISAAASLPAIAGMWLVRPLRDKMSPRVFRMVVLLFVLVAASQMIWKSGIFRHAAPPVAGVDSAHASTK